MHLKISSAQWRPFCPGGDELTNWATTGVSEGWISYAVVTSCIPILLALCKQNHSGSPHKGPVLWSFGILTLWPSGQTGIIIACVRRSAHRSVRLLVCKLYIVRTITLHRFELESSNLHQICILGYSHLVSKIGFIDLDLQGHFDHFDLEFLEIHLVCAITRYRFGLESPNLHQTYILGYSAGIWNKGHWSWPHFGHFDEEF